MKPCCWTPFIVKDLAHIHLHLHTEAQAWFITNKSLMHIQGQYGGRCPSKAPSNRKPAWIYNEKCLFSDLQLSPPSHWNLLPLCVTVPGFFLTHLHTDAAPTQSLNKPSAIQDFAWLFFWLDSSQTCYSACVICCLQPHYQEASSALDFTGRSLSTHESLLAGWVEKTLPKRSILSSTAASRGGSHLLISNVI